jgi:hypothetical protein
MTKLLFVYNADSGYFNVAVDIAHKIFSPSTYPCSLCDLTYGIFKIRPEWDEFIQNTPVPLEFLHKDEFLKAYPDWIKTPLPCILAERDGQMEAFVSAAELDHLTSIAELKRLIMEKLR